MKSARTRAAIVPLILAAALACGLARAQDPAAASAAASAPPAERCASCPALADAAASASAADELTRRMEAAARRVEAAASAAENRPLLEPAQDAKAVLLNLVANQLDRWLFGDGAGNTGLAAQFVAATALLLSLIKLVLASALLDPATPPSAWGRFKRLVRTTPAGRWINFVIALLMVLISVVALYAVMSARSASASGEQTLASMAQSLQSCHAELDVLRAQRVPAPVVTVPPPQANLEQLAQSCSKAAQASEASRLGLAQLQITADAIAAKQPWGLSKLLLFAALAFLVVFAIRKWP